MRTLSPGPSRAKRSSQMTVLVIAALLRASRVVDDLQTSEVDPDFDDVLGECNAAGGFVVDGEVFAHCACVCMLDLSASVSASNRVGNRSYRDNRVF